VGINVSMRADGTTSMAKMNIFHNFIPNALKINYFRKFHKTLTLRPNYSL
jgi:hypothetical protein